MSRRIDIELTSALGDGTWTWRAAGARKPKGVVDGSVLPDGVKVGDELKVEVEQEIDGITVLGVVQTRQKSAPDVIELLPADRDFQPVVETRAKRDRNDRGGRGSDRDRRPRRDRDDRGGDRGRGRDDRGRGRDGGGRGDGRGRSDGRGDGRRRDQGRRGPSFTPPPEVPQRPKPKRLRPGKNHRNTVLAELPEEQRAIAELALQGMGAVRQRVREENEKAKAEGRPPMPEASVMKIAEELLPKLRVAEWLDRAEAAQRQMEHLDLRDLRSVVAAAGDPNVARDEEASALVAELKSALVQKQEQELVLWFGDVDAALAVGRVIRALRLSSQPPKAGVPFPVDIAHRLADSVNASLAPMDSPERWAAMLEAAAFSPVRSLIKPARKPDVVNDELLATVKRLAPALPQIAELFEVEVDITAPMPKPLRPNVRQRKDSQSAHDGNRKGSARKGRKERPPKQPPASPTTSSEAPAGHDVADEDSATTPPQPSEATPEPATAPPAQPPAATPEPATAPPAQPPEATPEPATAPPDQPPEATTEPATAPPAQPVEAPAEPVTAPPAQPTEAPAEPAAAPPAQPAESTPEPAADEQGAAAADDDDAPA